MLNSCLFILLLALVSTSETSSGVPACQRSDISNPRVYVNAILFEGGLKDFENPMTVRNITELASLCYDGKFYAQVNEEECSYSESSFDHCRRRRCCRKVEGIMISVNAPPVNNEYDRLRRLFRELNLRPGCTVAVFNPLEDLTGGVNFSREIQEVAISRMIEYLDRCAILGGEIMTGPWVVPLRARPEITDPNQLVQHINSRLKFGLPAIKTVVEEAAKRGIDLRVEYVNNKVAIAPNYLPQTIALCELVRESPNFSGVKTVTKNEGVTCGIDVDTSHELLSPTNGPTLLGDLFQYMKERRITFDIAPGDPDKGSLVESWNPWDRVYSAAQAIEFSDILPIEIFQSTPQNVVNLGFTRPPFEDPLQVMKDSIQVTLIEWERAPESDKNVRPGSYSRAVESVRKFKRLIREAE